MDDTSDVPAKPAGKRPFLKRGEGVQKRVFGPVIKKQRDVDRDDDASAYGQTPDSVRGRSSDVDRSRGKDQGRDQTPAARPAPRAQPAWREDDSFSAVLEAPVRSSLVTARPGAAPSAGGQVRAPSAVSQPSAPLSALQDDLELAEFEALEEQIRKDLGHTGSTTSTFRDIAGSAAFLGGAPRQGSVGTADSAQPAATWGRTDDYAGPQHSKQSKESLYSTVSPGPAHVYGARDPATDHALPKEEPEDSSSLWAVEDELVGVVSPEVLSSIQRGQSTNTTISQWPHSDARTSPNDAYRTGSQPQLQPQLQPQQSSQWWDDQDTAVHTGVRLASESVTQPKPHDHQSAPSGASAAPQYRPAAGAVGAAGGPAASASEMFSDDHEEWGVDDDLGRGHGLSYQASSTLQWFQRDGGHADAYTDVPGASRTGPGAQKQGPMQATSAAAAAAASLPSDSPAQSPPLTQPFVRSLFANSAAAGAGSAGRAASGGRGAVAGGGRSRSATSGGGGSGATSKEQQSQSQLLSAQDSERLAQLEQEYAKLQQERAALSRLRTDLEKAATRLEAERSAWERRQASESSTFETWRAAEMARLERDRRVLDKQSKAILKLPTKKERSAVEAVEAVLEEERREARATAARHKLTVERLRRQLLDQQEKNRELREEIRWHEAQRLELTGPEASSQRSGARSGATGTGGGGSGGRTAASGGAAAAAKVPAVSLVGAGVQAELGSESLHRVQLQEAAQLLLPHLSHAPPANNDQSNTNCSSRGPRPQQPSNSAASSGRRGSTVDATQTAQAPQQPASGRRGSGAAGAAPAASAASRGQESQTSHGAQAAARGSTIAAASSAQGLRAAKSSSTSDKVLQSEKLRDEYGHANGGGGDDGGGSSTGAEVRGSLADWHTSATTTHTHPTHTHTHPAHPNTTKPIPHTYPQHTDSYEEDTYTDEYSDQGAYGVATQGGNVSRGINRDQQGTGRAQGAYGRGTDGTDGGYMGSGYEEGDYMGEGGEGEAQTGGEGVWDQGEEDEEALAQIGSTLRLLRVERKTPHAQHEAAAWDAQASHTSQQPRSRTDPYTQASRGVVAHGGVRGQQQGAAWSDEASWDDTAQHGDNRDEPYKRPQHAQQGQQQQQHYHDQDAYGHDQAWERGYTQQGPRHSNRQAPQTDVGSRDTQAQGYDRQASSKGMQAAAASARAPAGGPPGQQRGGGEARRPGSSASRDPVVRRVRYNDGKEERYRASGRRDVFFANGTRKVVLPGGTTLIQFANGDVKQQLPSGCTEYYYAQVQTWHSTYTEDGVEVFHFPSGQREAHFAHTGDKEILFPDGSTRRVRADGSEESVPPQRLHRVLSRPCPSNMMEHMAWDECHEQDMGTYE